MLSARPSPESIRALSALLQPPPSVMPFSRFTPEDWHGVLRAANACWLIGALEDRFRAHHLSSHIPGDVQEYVEGAAELARERAKQQCREIALVARTLNRSGIQPVILKGSAAHVSRLYPDSADRLCTDIDLLVDPPTVERAIGVLRENGYVSQVPSGPRDLGAYKHEPILIRQDRLFGIEIHRSLADAPYRSVLPAKEALAAALPLEIEDATVLLLQPEHRVIHCIVHAMAHYWEGSPISLRQLMELRQLIEHFQNELAWSSITSRFERAGLRSELEYCLLMSAHLVGLRRPPLAYSRTARLRGHLEYRYYGRATWAYVPWATYRAIRTQLRTEGAGAQVERLNHADSPWKRIRGISRLIYGKARRIS